MQSSSPTNPDFITGAFAVDIGATIGVAADMYLQ
jgi:hypothetical protein